MSAEAGRLAEQQRALLALVKDRPITEPAPDQDRPAETADPYLEQVSNSHGLAMIRTIRARWLRFDVERYAPLTSGALAHAGRLEAELTLLGRDSSTPSGVDALGLHFVERYTADAESLIAAVATTERALILLARGDQARHEVSWDQDPAAVLNALLAGEAPPTATPGTFRVIVSHALPQLIEVQRVVQPEFGQA
jgi:hypothetical protein